MWGWTGGSVSLGYMKPCQETELGKKREEIKKERGGERKEGERALLRRCRSTA